MLPPNLYARVRFCHVHWHARPRVRRAPGLPCALLSSGGQRNVKTSGETCREIAKACPRHCERSDPIHASLPCLPLRARWIASPSSDCTSGDFLFLVAPVKTLSLPWHPALKTRGVAAGTHSRSNRVALAKESHCSQTCRKCVWNFHWGQPEYQSMRLSAFSNAAAERAGVICCVLFMAMSAQALAQTSATDNPGPAAAQSSVPAQEKPAAASEEKPAAADDITATAGPKP